MEFLANFLIYMVYTGCVVFIQHSNCITTKMCKGTSCRENNESKVKNEMTYYDRLELIKLDLLSKLKLKTAPERRNIRIPKGVIDGFLDKVSKSKKQHGNKPSAVDIYIPGKIVQCELGLNCVRFQRHQINTTQRISNIVLWLKQRLKRNVKQEISTLTIKVINSNNKQEFIIKKHIHIIEFGWLSININEIIKPFSTSIETSRNLNILVDISCSNCEISFSEGRHPMMVLTFEKKSKTRIKRSLNECSSKNNECCLEDIYVDTVSLRWDWIIQPTEFYARQCSGTCRYSLPKLSHRQLNHDSGVGKTLAYFQHKVKSTDFCCVSRGQEKLELLYFNHQGLIMREEVDWSASSCTCL